MAKKKKVRVIARSPERSRRTTKQSDSAAKSQIASLPTVTRKDQTETTVNITSAKGRPMLTWVGKRPLTQVTAFPAQLVEVFDPANTQRHSVPTKSGSESKPGGSTQMLKQVQHDGELWNDWPSAYPKAGLLFHGDNKEVLAHLLANGFRGKVKLITTDPPFDSGADYVRKVSLRGAKGTTKLGGETYTLGEQIQYTDIWTNDNYLQFMYERLILLKELLSEDGAILMHCDYHKGYFIRCLMEEVFGADNFRNEIVTKRVQKNFAETEYVKTMNNAYDTLVLYSKGSDFRLLPPKKRTDFDYSEIENWHSFDAPNWSGGRPNLTYELFGQYPPTGNVWRWTKDKAEEAIKIGKLRPNPNTGKPEYLVDDSNGQMVNNLWVDILAYSNNYDYPTEKSERLITRIVSCFSREGNIVLDPFIGSGTTAAVAQKLGRRWIGCDINKGAIQTTSKRLQTIINEQIEEINKKTNQGELLLEVGRELNSLPTALAQLSFAVYRVNDYDLQIQHNEAVNLACEHIGISRTHNDAFFDGTLGKRLVKIVPFNHPLSPVDLEEIKKELKGRPSEDRDIVVVCLGKELATDAWIEEWNRLRKRGDVPNKIEVIELRTDPKYGKFIKHEPAKARVKVSRKGGKIHVIIEDFISPSIIERLNQQAGILQPKIDDWRSMVDCIMIDANYNGEVFNVILSDVPEKKTDLVSGNYEIPVPEVKTKVAVKIIDMLGEEVLEVKEV